MKYSLDDAKRTVKPVEPWFVVLALDSFNLYVVKSLANWGKVSPNLVSWAALLLFSGAAASFWQGTYPFLLLGATLWYAALFLDSVDGKLARLTGRVSSLGEVIEFLHNFPGGFLSLAALTFNVSRPLDGMGLVLAGLYAAFLFAAITQLSIIYWLRRKRPSSDIYQTLTTRAGHPWFRKRRLRLFPGHTEAAVAVFMFGPLLNNIILGLAIGVALASFDAWVWLWEKRQLLLRVAGKADATLNG